jgi:putative spermidine/putrescine transport system permease protein
LFRTEQRGGGTDPKGVTAIIYEEFHNLLPPNFPHYRLAMDPVGPARPRSGLVAASASPRILRTLLSLPVFALLAVFFLWPLLNIVLRSLDPSGEVTYLLPHVSLGHYTEIFRDPALRSVVVHTFEVAAWATAVTTILAFPTAYLFSRLSRRTATVLLALILVPFWMSILVRLFAFTQILGHNGVVNSVAHDLHLGGPYSLLFNTRATVIGMVTYLLPFMILILYAGMSAVDTTLITAAKTLGSSGARAFRMIYLPLVWPTLVSGMLLVFVLSLGFFLTPAILGGPQDTTIPMYIQQQVQNFQWGSACAIGTLLLIVTVTGYGIAMFSGGMSALTRGESHALGKGAAERERLDLSLSTVMLWLVAVVVMLFLLLPLVVIVPISFESPQILQWPPVGFTTTWYSQVFTDPQWTDAIKKSAIVGLGTAVLSTSIGLILARIATQLQSRTVRSVLAAFVYSPLVMPLMLLAIGIYDVEARLKLLGTSIGLVFAHSVIAFPVAFAVLSTALANLDPSLEAAAWSLGASRRRTFWCIVIPNVIPSLIGALLITFVISWDEVVIALFQTGLQKTLPVTIFSFLNSGVEPSVAAVATMLAALVVLGVVITLVVGARRSRRKRPARLAASMIVDSRPA